MARKLAARRRGGGGIEVEGLDELIRSLARIDKKLAGEIRKELRRVGTIVTKRQRERAIQKGLVGKTRKLSRSNRPAVKGSTLVVQNRATAKDGYPYPLRYEFEGRVGNMPGPRAFFYRPVEESEPELLEALDDALGRVAAKEDWD